MNFSVTDFFRACMPYCILRHDDGSYVILNRLRKPIGFSSEDWVNYADYPVNIFFRKIDKRTAKKLSVFTEFDENLIYLYDYLCYPTSSEESMKAYMAKLEILMRWKILSPERRPLLSNKQILARNNRTHIQIS